MFAAGLGLFAAASAACALATSTGALIAARTVQGAGAAERRLPARASRLLPWGIAPFLIAPRAGALADRIGERPLIVAGTLLLGIGMGWLALVAGPSAPLLEMIASALTA